MSLKKLILDNALARIIIRILLHFDTVPAAIDLHNYRFYIISNVGYTVAWIIHFTWLVIFFNLGQHTMTALQLASIACHVVAITLNRRGHHLTAMVVGMLEVIGHQLLAVKLLGWGAGFQYIIPAIVLFPFLNSHGNKIIKVFLVLCCVTSYLGLELFLKNTTPIYQLTSFALQAFNYSNIVFCFGLITIWGIYITIAIQRSEAVLIEKNKELFAAEKAKEKAELQRLIEVKDRDAEIYRLRNVELKNSNDEILLRNKIIEQEKKRSDDLLLNILPMEVAEELKDKGSAAAKHFDHVTVMFTDFVGFTKISEQMDAQQLIDELDACFKGFDGIIGKYNIEKIKTIGDAYLAVAGLPTADPEHAKHVVNAALEIVALMDKRRKTLGDKTFQLRVGVHSGSVVAGIVGIKKFAYDIWGDTVNVAARMEQNSLPGRVNISGATYELVKDDFDCEYRGQIHAKNKGEMDMYFVTAAR